jgi:hypothetical protein
MNFTVCGKTNKVIRNWERQCLPCEHACIVIARGTHGENKMSFGAAFLFKCPHISFRHKIIGYDTWKSQPRTRVDLVEIGCFIPFIPENIRDSLSWEDLPVPLEPTDKTQIARIPREKWGELLDINVPSNPEPCTLCKR